ncbi:MAG: hypothetical protein ACYDD4_13060 [Acidimicrobiales bacterium]
MRMRTDEQGVIALAVAVSISSLLFVSGMLAYQVASTNQGDSSFRRAQDVALDAAEGGLNRTYQAIQAAATASVLPCGTGAETETLHTLPAASSYSTTVQYYDTFPPTDVALSCSSVQSGSSTPVAAEVLSTGSSGIGSATAATQYMEALLKVTLGTITGSVFDQAIFSNSTMTGGNNPTIDSPSDNGNLYTNGSVLCGNNFVVQGNVTAQGSFTGANNCNIQGNLTAVGNISMANNTVIGGNATSTGHQGCASQGNITMVNNAIVDQSAYAYCSITMANGATVVHSKVPNDTTLSNPAVETFPSLPEPVAGSSAASAWSAAGYTNQVTNNNCSTGTTVYQQINAMSTATTPTVIMTTCPLVWTGNNTIQLNTNLAVFSTGGFSMANNTTWESTNSTTRALYIIVPSSVNGTATTCTAGQPGITYANNTTFASSGNPVNVFDYTPCTFVAANNAAGSGQIYAGTVDAVNNFSMHYVSMPTVPGASGGGTSTSSTTIAVVYERQISSLSAA